MGHHTAVCTPLDPGCVRCAACSAFSRSPRRGCFVTRGLEHCPPRRSFLCHGGGGQPGALRGPAGSPAQQAGVSWGWRGSPRQELDPVSRLRSSIASHFTLRAPGLAGGQCEHSTHLLSSESDFSVLGSRVRQQQALVSALQRDPRREPFQGAGSFFSYT